MVSVGGNERGGRRSLDAEINLVPFIDLLSMCICFLLMTAVWIQMQVVQVKQAKGTEAPKTTSPFDLKIDLTSATTLNFLVEKEGKPVRSFAILAANRAELERELDKALSTIISPDDPNAASLIQAAVITPHPDAPYSQLISIMDILRQHQVVNLGVGNRAS